MIPENLAGPSISLEKVSLKSGAQILLQDISCKFEAKKWHAILGPNGGGKSTLLRTILGLNNHTGTINIDWPITTSQPNNTKERIGYIPQLMPFDASLPISVRDYLLMSLSSRPIWFKRSLPSNITEALKHIELTDKLDRKIGDLSGGERQRLMITTALLQNPSLLILDEPMTGLDRQGREDTLQLLTRFHKSGGTILMVEHDWNLVNQHCDRAYWIDKGLAKTDSPSELLAWQSQHSECVA